MGERARSSRADAPITVGVPVVGLVLAVATIAALNPNTEAITRIPQLFPALQGLDIVAGMSMVVAGALAWIAGRRPVGLAGILAALCWFGADWAGNGALPGALRVTGIVALTLTLPLVGWAVAATRPPRISPPTRNVLAVATTSLIVLTVLWVVTWMPALDPRCLAICDVNPFGVAADFRLARTFANAWQGLTTILGVGVAASALYSLARGSRAARRQRGPLLGGAVLVGVAWAAWGVSLLLPSTTVAPSGHVALALFATRGIALTVLAIGLGWWILNIQRTVDAVQLIADRLSPFPGVGTLASGLAEALGDPRLRLLYALPGNGGYIEADGRVALIDSGEMAGDRMTAIRNGNEVVAIALHSPEASREPISPQLGAAVQLAADNERLLASVRHELIELRASRSRIVETGDGESRRLERNLHDGAQQRMLMVVHELAVARDFANAAGHPAADTLAQAVVETDATIEALRTLARGIHPAFLEEAGLGAALEALADEAPLPVIIEAVPETRFGGSIELAAWRVCAQCVSGAASHGAAWVRLSVTSDEHHLRIQIDIDDPGAIDTIRLEDIAGAAGGSVVTSKPNAGAMRIFAELPCA